METRLSLLMQLLQILTKDNDPTNYPLKEKVEVEIAKELDIPGYK